MTRIAVGSSKAEELSRQSKQLGQKPRGTKRLAGIPKARKEERSQFNKACLYLLMIKGQVRQEKEGDCVVKDRMRTLLNIL